MACQHILFGSAEKPIPIPQECQPAIWFQPILDTFEHGILAHQCLLRLSGTDYGGDIIEASRFRSLAIHAAAREAGQRLYFLPLAPSSIEDLGLDLVPALEAIFDSGMKPGDLVFEMAEADLARDPAHSRRLREYLRSNGIRFALSNAGMGPGTSSFQAVSYFAPDYIKLDQRLIRNMDQPPCAPAISKLVQMADKSGACVVAEGVDRVRMVENLWLLGVRFMQGYLFGAPSPHIA